MKKIRNVLLVIAIALLLSGCTTNETNSEEETINANVDETIEIENDEGEINIRVDADIGVVTDCGDIDCFEAKFATCEQSSATFKLMDTIEYYYEILGPKDGLCEVKSKFVANPNPAWIDEEMVCLYDNSLKFNTAISDMSNCKGSLYTLMTEG